MSFFDAHTHKLDQPLSLVSLSLTDIPKSLPAQFSIGIHPWEMSKDYELNKLEEYATHENCLAIGETGIDRSPKFVSTIDQQITLFKEHIHLAQKLNKPLVIHSVRAYSDIHHLISKFQFSNSIIFHDYNGNKEITEKLLNFDSYFSYGDKLFHSDSKGYKNINLIPRERLLLESDDSGRYISEVYKKASQVLGIEIEKLEAMINANVEKSLSIPLFDK